MRALVLAIVTVVGALAGTVAAADPVPAARDAVALLPLDSRRPDGRPDPRLEIYGQPVATEVARALNAADLEVLVVAASGEIPKRAKVIVDGTITNQGDSITVTLRIRRNHSDKKPREPIVESAANLAGMEKAARALSARAVPAVRDELAAIATEAAQAQQHPEQPFVPEPKLAPLLVGIAGDRDNATATEPLRAAFGELVPVWARTNRHEARTVDASRLAAKLAPQTVKAGGVERGLAFEVIDYSVTQGKVPLARARVRVRIADNATVMFDRVIVTDTVVGDRDMAAPKLAQRVAREVLSIALPHIRRTVATWP